MILKISASSSSSVSDLIQASSDGIPASRLMRLASREVITGYPQADLCAEKIGHLGLSAVTFVQLAALCRFGRGQLAGPHGGTRRATSAAALESKSERPLARRRAFAANRLKAIISQAFAMVIALRVKPTAAVIDTEGYLGRFSIEFGAAASTNVTFNAGASGTLRLANSFDFS